MYPILHTEPTYAFKLNLMRKYDSKSSYKQDYPVHELEQRMRVQPQAVERPNIPLDAVTTNMADFKVWDLPERSSPARNQEPRQSVPFTGTSTSRDNYRAWEIAPRSKEPAPQLMAEKANFGVGIPVGASVVTDVEDYQRWELERRVREPQQQQQRPSVPFEGTSENRQQFRQWDLPERSAPVTRTERAPSLPFTATTTTGDDFKGWQLPPKRSSLGVETVGDHLHILIRRSAATPAEARAIFTTVHDNQSEVCIMVLSGENPVASQNRLLGRFDLVGIPPAPADVPQIEVVFKLDDRNVLTVEARDLDTGRHELWRERKGSIVVHET
eukprot:gene2451-3185_t